MNMIGCLLVIHYGGNTAQSVNSFVENNDFIGKTVIPFCTSSSDEIGESGQLLAGMVGTGNWLEDFHQVYLKMIFKNGFQV